MVNIIRTLVDRVKERLGMGPVVGVQLYTPLIFKGPGLLRELRRGDYSTGS